jgi:hypothetical protein
MWFFELGIRLNHAAPRSSYILSFDNKRGNLEEVYTLYALLQLCRKRVIGNYTKLISIKLVPYTFIYRATLELVCL